MRFQFLVPLCSLFLLALAGVEDNTLIHGEISYSLFIEDAKLFDRLDKVFLPNATFVADGDRYYGISAIKAFLSKGFPAGSVSQSAATTQLIELDPPFDPLGAAARANSTTYVTVTYFGRGNETGEIESFFGVLQDSFVKTADFPFFGGWKISERIFTSFGPGVGDLTTPAAATNSTSTRRRR